ncbi:MAG: amidohydrolase family protein [Clostridiaceae bacterium]|nr:amidohydrolase family protein [Clostridiaceae bacterium]
METTKGRLKAGFLVDLIVLDTDIFTCAPDDILNILPVMTMVGGKIVYQQ